MSETETDNVLSPVDISQPPMKPEEVQERLTALNELDVKIVQLLEMASSAIKTLENGKKAPESELAEANDVLKEQVEAYYGLLEETSVELRREVRKFHYASKEKVLPLTLATKADWVAKEKEKEVWERIDELLAKRS